jgi:regulatory protein
VAARWLARAPRTEAELERRLVGVGSRRETAAATVARCRELGWVGDATFARDRARALRARGAGSLRIEADLIARGIPEAVVADAIEGSRDGEPEREWARRAVRGLRDPRKAWRLLVSRGFAEEIVADVVGEPDAGEDDPH